MINFAFFSWSTHKKVVKSKKKSSELLGNYCNILYSNMHGTLEWERVYVSDLDCIELQTTLELRRL